MARKQKTSRNAFPDPSAPTMSIWQVALAAIFLSAVAWFIVLIGQSVL